jgi:hypothetical protein
MTYFIFILLLLGIVKIWDSNFTSNSFFNKFIQIIISSLVIATVLYYFIWNDYGWADRIISKNNSDTSFNKLAEETDWELIKPYSWFKPYPIQVTYIDKHNIGRFNSKFYFARVLNLYKNNNNFNGTSIYLFDVHENKFCSLNEDEIQHLDLKNITLKNIKKSETRLLCVKDYLIKNIKPYYLYGIFGELFDVSSLISSGKYYVKGTDSIIGAIYNYNPSKLQKKDFVLLNSKLNSSYPGQKFNLNNDSIKYLETNYNDFSDIKLSDTYSLQIFDKIKNQTIVVKFYLVKDSITKKDNVIFLDKNSDELIIME